MDDTTLLDRLIASCSKQQAWFAELNATTQKALGDIVRSRGDVSGLARAFQAKKHLLSLIDAEKESSKALVAQWQERKSAIGGTGRAARLDSIVAEMQKTIRQFLDGEEQVRKYLEHALSQAQ